MRIIPAFVATLTVCCLMAIPASADSITILSVTGGPSSGIPVGGSQSSPAESQYLGISFVLGSSFDDVAITVPGLVFINWAGTAWLTNAIGPAATPSNVIATATVDPFPGTQGVSTTTFLSGLNLSPGTYFFFLSSPFCDGSDFSSGCGFGFWQSPSNPTIQTAAGAGLFGEEIVGGFQFPCQNPANCPAANFVFPPASPWTFNTFSNSTPLAIEITGSPVPEPSSLMLLSTGLLAMWGIGLRKRRRAHS